MLVARKIFFPGMGADQRVFAPQLQAFPAAVAAQWIPPRPRESLQEYGARFAEALAQSAAQGADVIDLIGASFGGFVALEVARHLPRVRHIILIGSVRAYGELPRRVRMFWPIRRLALVFPFELVVWGCRLLRRGRCTWMSPTRRASIQMLGDQQASWLRWAAWAVLTWGARDPAVKYDVVAERVRHIHGDRDGVLPLRCTKPHAVVRGRHVISLSCPDEVNQFLRMYIADAQSRPNPP